MNTSRKGLTILALLMTYGWVCSSAFAAVYSVVSYGAVADGVTDDSAAFQAAIDAAYAASGGVVYAPTGTYKLDSPIVMKDNVTLRGDGKTNTILDFRVEDGWPGMVIRLYGDNIGLEDFKAISGLTDPDYNPSGGQGIGYNTNDSGYQAWAGSNPQRGAENFHISGVRVEGYRDLLMFWSDDTYFYGSVTDSEFVSTEPATDLTLDLQPANGSMLWMENVLVASMNDAGILWESFATGAYSNLYLINSVLDDSQSSYGLIQSGTSTVIRVSGSTYNPAKAEGNIVEWDTTSSSVSVTDPLYGAVGDEVTDDSGAFQHAIDNVCAAGGGVVFAPAGWYKLDSPIVMKDNVTLRGDGKTATVLDFRAESGYGPGMVIRLYGDNIGLEDFKAISGLTNPTYNPSGGQGIGYYTGDSDYQAWAGSNPERGAENFRISGVRVEGYRDLLMFWSNDTFFYGSVIDSEFVNTEPATDLTLFMQPANGSMVWLEDVHVTSMNDAGILWESFAEGDDSNLYFINSVMNDSQCGAGLVQSGTSTVIYVSGSTYDLEKTVGNVLEWDTTSSSVSVTDPLYGAVGDEVTDDSGAFQHAIDNVYAAGGGVVFAPAGWYKLDSPIVMKDNVTLRGDTGNDTILDFYASGPTGMGIIIRLYGDNIGLENLVVLSGMTGSSSGCDGAQGIGYNTLDSDYQAWAGSTTGRGAENFHIDNVYVEGCRDLLMFWPGATHFYGSVTNSTFYARSSTCDLTLDLTPLDGSVLWMEDVHVIAKNDAGILWQSHASGAQNDLYFINSVLDDSQSSYGLVQYGSFTAIYVSGSTYDSEKTIGKITSLSSGPAEGTCSVTVTDSPYSAAGDGTTDDSQAFQDAIDDVHDGEGGVVCVPAGTYKLDSAIVMKDNVTLRGAGKANTILDFRVESGWPGMVIRLYGDNIGLEDFKAISGLTNPTYNPSGGQGIGYYTGDSGYEAWADSNPTRGTENFHIANVRMEGYRDLLMFWGAPTYFYGSVIDTEFVCTQAACDLTLDLDPTNGAALWMENVTVVSQNDGGILWENMASGTANSLYFINSVMDDEEAGAGLIQSGSSTIIYVSGSAYDDEKTDGTITPLP